MASEINPSLTPTKSLSNFRFWCQKVLPLVYDDSLSYYEVLGKMVVQLNDVIDDVNADTENVLTLKDAFLELQTYVNEFFDDIDQLASYAERAEDAQTAANASAINAASSASNASASSLAAMNARDAAVTAKEAAEASASTASTAATNANTKASEATQSAITAQTAQASASQSATLAAIDRSAAQTAANTATTKASEASTSASNAEESATSAEQSKNDAESLVNNVQESLDNIQQNTQDIAELKETTNLNLVYKFNKRILRTGSLQPNGAADNSTHTMTMYNKVFIPANHAIEITLVNTPNIDYDNMQIRVVRFTTDSMLTTPAGTIILNNTITENTVTIPAITTDSYIMVGYYFHINNTPVNDVLASYNYGVTIFEISVVGASDKIYSETNTNQLLETILFSIAPVFSGYVAERSLTINDLCIINNVLYIATANIPDREPLSVGTNITVTSLNDVIKSLR